MSHHITKDKLNTFSMRLQEAGKSSLTIKKYMSDITKMVTYFGNEEVTQTKMNAYVDYLLQNYTVKSVNSYISVANAFFRVMGWADIFVSKIPEECDENLPEEKYLTYAEYNRLIQTAISMNMIRMVMVIQTLGNTDLHLTEFGLFTVEMLKRGVIELPRRKRIHKIVLPAALKTELEQYVDEKKIVSGPVFQTAKGKPMDRSNIWKELKKLCKLADIDDKKVYPQNLRNPLIKEYLSVFR